MPFSINYTRKYLSSFFIIRRIIRKTQGYMFNTYKRMHLTLQLILKVAMLNAFFVSVKHISLCFLNYSSYYERGA